jgi:hypothetical protein
MSSLRYLCFFVVALFVLILFRFLLVNAYEVCYIFIFGLHYEGVRVKIHSRMIIRENIFIVDLH